MNEFLLWLEKFRHDNSDEERWIKKSDIVRAYSPHKRKYAPGQKLNSELFNEMLKTLDRLGHIEFDEESTPQRVKFIKASPR